MIEKVKNKENLDKSIMFATYEDEQKKLPPFVRTGKNTVLIFKFNDQNCDLCVDSVMSILKRQKWGNKIQIEIWNQTLGAESIFKHKLWYNNVEHVNFKKISNETSELASDKYGKPYLFVFDQTRNSVSSVYFPDISHLDDITKYLSIVKKKFFESD